MIEDKAFKGESTIKFRDSFVEKSAYEPSNPTICFIKEYLCEAFCLIDIIEEIKLTKINVLLNELNSDQEVEEDLKIHPTAHPFQNRKEISISEITNENDKTKETLGAKNSDLMENDHNSFYSPKNEPMTDMRSRYIKKTKNNHSNFSNISNITPNKKSSRATKSKMNKSRSKLMNNSVAKLHKKEEKKMVRNCSTKKKLNTRIVPYKSIQNGQNEYECQNKSIPTTPVNKRIASIKKKISPTKKARINSPKKKPVTPMKPSNRPLEQKFESHLPNTIRTSHQVKKKSPKKAVKMRPELYSPKHKMLPVKPYIEHFPSSPQRVKNISPKMSPVRRSPKKEYGRISPTKRMIQMKNSYIKNQRKAQKDPENAGKLIYTISPSEAYIVNQEFFNSMENEDLAKKSSELCYSADKERSQQYGDSMMKQYRNRRMY
jgi:hypothetical protein